MINLTHVNALKRDVNRLQSGNLGDIKPHADEKENVHLITSLHVVQLSERMDEIEKKLDRIARKLDC